MCGALHWWHFEDERERGDGIEAKEFLEGVRKKTAKHAEGEGGTLLHVLPFVDQI